MVDVVNFSLPYERWEYVNTLNVADYTAIPTRYLVHQRVLLGNIEARYTDIREFFNLALSKNIINRASFFNPIFTFWGQTTAEHDLIIRVAPAVTGTLEYYEMPAFPVNMTDIIRIPYEYESLLEDLILSQLYLRLKEMDKLKDIHLSISNRKSELIQEYKMYNETKVRELDTFVKDEQNPMNFKSVKSRKK
jgi:hypothetical protein